MSRNEVRKKAPHRHSLENEVIIAVVVLYLVIAIVMVVVHYIQPPGQEAATSSMSPTHSDPKPSKADAK